MLSDESRDMNDQADAVERIRRQVDRLSLTLERMRLDEYVEYLSNPGRMMRQSFLSGLVRGLGTAVGFTILGAVVVVAVSRIVVDNVPWLGDFLADVVRVVQSKLK